MVKRFCRYGIYACLIFVLFGCQLDRSEGHHDPDVLNVVFISSLPPAFQEAMVDYIEQQLVEEVDQGLEVNVMMSFPSYDRLTVEIINREADVLIVDEFLEHILMDPYLLTPLDHLSEHLIDDVDYLRYKRPNELETEEHLYAVPLKDGNQFIHDLGVVLEEDLIVGIVNTSPHKKVAFRLIEQWL